MNFLAHIYLANEDEGLLVGNFIADFIRNKELPNFSKEIQNGILLHRQIDMYTDNHPVVRQGTHRLQKNHHKYAPVVIDILYDYFLANNWEKYSKSPLQDFANNSYKVLENHMDQMPDRLKLKLPSMIEHNWLMGYKSIEGMKFTFQKMSERTNFPDNFALATEDLIKDEALLHKEFNQFFPELINFVANCSKELQTNLNN